MGKVLAIDYGHKRTGLAVSDPLWMCCSSAQTVDTPRLFSVLRELFETVPIDTVVVGYPTDLQMRTTDATKAVDAFVANLSKQFPTLSVQTMDERLTSKMAYRTLHQLQMKKKYKHDKRNVDKMAAAILLQDFLSLHRAVDL